MFEIADLLRTAPDGRGIISCLELAAVQEHPELFSTALMWLLAELFEALPEAGDLDRPKLVFFLDEAHLLFDGATEAFLEAIERTVRLIRSKGVGVFFVTQTPKDVPADVLAQLGNRIQHALRAFTPDDAKDLRATVSTFPKSEFYDLEELLTQLGIGEAAVTILSESGVPTPVVHAKLPAPRLADGPGRRRRRRGQGLAAAGEVRHAGRQRVGPREARGADRGRRAGGARARRRAAGAQARAQGGGQGRRAAGWRPCRSSCSPGRASSCSARSCAACSGC